MSKQLATVQRDVQVDFDPKAEAAREPDRSRLREVFREYELRDPLRRLEEALGRRRAGAAPAPPTRSSSPPACAQGAVGDIAASWRRRAGPGGRREELCVAVRAGRGRPRASCSPRARRGASPVAADGRRACVGRRRAHGRRRRLRARAACGCGEPRWSPTTPRRSGSFPPGLVHDTLLGAYLLEPARRGYPFAELCEERGSCQRPGGPSRPPRRC